MTSDDLSSHTVRFTDLAGFKFFSKHIEDAPKIEETASDGDDTYDEIDVIRPIDYTALRQTGESSATGSRMHLQRPRSSWKSSLAGEHISHIPAHTCDSSIQQVLKLKEGDPRLPAGMYARLPWKIYGDAVNTLATGLSDWLTYIEREMPKGSLNHDGLETTRAMLKTISDTFPEQRFQYRDHASDVFKGLAKAWIHVSALTDDELTSQLRTADEIVAAVAEGTKEVKTAHDRLLPGTTIKSIFSRFFST